MKNTVYLFSLALTAIGVAIGIPAFLDWMHLIFSGTAFDGNGFSSKVEPTFVRFTIGAIFMAAGQGLWKAASSRGSSNTTYNNQRYNHRYSKNTHNYKDVLMGDQYNVRGQAGAIGTNAYAHSMNFNQNNAQFEGSLDLVQLAEELSKLRQVMMNKATVAEHSIAIGEVAKAEKAAKEKNASKVMEHLNAAGHWALDIASKIGVPVAVEVLKRSI